LQQQIRSVEAKEEVIEHIDQLSMFVGGSAGTGKSFLINAIRALFALYGKSSWLQVAASTGTAPKGIGGRTIQSLLRIKVRNSKGDYQESELDDKDKDSKVARGTADMRFLIIDEVSMIVVSPDKSIKNYSWPNTTKARGEVSTSCSLAISPNFGPAHRNHSTAPKPSSTSQPKTRSPLKAENCSRSYRLLSSSMNSNGTKETNNGCNC